jgi:outer membrane immunogenic protein
MHKLLLGSIAVASLIAGPAVAADLPLKAPPPPVVYDSWTGFYVGAALGGKWANTTWTTTSTSDFPGTIVDASSPRNFNPSGTRIAGYAGYNWQNQAWLFGVEFDVAYANNTASSVGIPGCTILCFPGAPGPGVDASSVKMGWDASARARIGYLATPSLLVYGTGGIAWQEIQTSGFCQHSGADPACTDAAGAPFDTVTNSKTLTGWTIGGGVEAKMYGNWLLRGEYRYANFGTFDRVLSFGAPGAPLGTDFVRYNLSVNTHIATIGLAYKFGGPVAAGF